MDIFLSILFLIIVINTILAMITVFRERRDTSSTWAWLLVLTFLPIVGFIFYYFFGRKIDRDETYDVETNTVISYLLDSEEQRQKLYAHEVGLSENLDRPEVLQMIDMFMTYTDAPLATSNHVDIYVDGEEKFDQLLKDIEGATESVNIMYYIFRNDKIGMRIIHALEKKAAEGVEVHLMIDSLGSRQTRKKTFDDLMAAGGKFTYTFSKNYRILDNNINFRNHRKIVIIDGKIGYVGGFNVGDDYLGEYEHMGYWRDTHLRIIGSAVPLLHAQFIMDWNASIKDERDKMNFYPEAFSSYEKAGSYDMQIVSSGPDNDMELIKKGLMKMIMVAKESFYLQTPYFIPDQTMLDLLKTAIASGVDVKIMIPNKPDHPFIYQATLYYARDIMEAGAEVYIYDKGFLHSKTAVVDGEIATVGTANFDPRSFSINFEINAFVYNEEFAEKNIKIFQDDIQDSYLMTQEIVDNFSRWQRFKMSFSRLLSPLL